jgi:anti-anti-sigma regulatory factor
VGGILTVFLLTYSAQVADDDLLSLDFTSWTPAPKPASAAPPVVAPPVRAAVEEVLAPAIVPPPPRYAVISCPQTLSDAAQLYAQGNDIDTSRCLETALKRNTVSGDAAPRVWQALFEVLQRLGRKPAFETLALAYARKFGASPPPWAVPESVECEVTAKAETAGFPSVSLSGTLNAEIGDALKQVMKAAQNSGGVSIDLSAAVDADNDGATLLIRAMKALRKAKKTCVFVKPLPLAKALNAKLLPGQRENEALWLLQIELYQQAFEKAAFEDAAVGYAVTFEVSPPSYVEAPHDASTEPDATKIVESSAQEMGHSGLSLRGDLRGMAADDFSYLTAAISENRDDSDAAKSPTLDIDASGLLRIDGASAFALAQILQAMNEQEHYVRLTGLSQLVAAFLAATDVSRHAELVLRKA